MGQEQEWLMRSAVTREEQVRSLSALFFWKSDVIGKRGRLVPSKVICWELRLLYVERLKCIGSNPISSAYFIKLQLGDNPWKKAFLIKKKQKNYLI